MAELIPYILAILAGIFTTFEASINAGLGKIVSPKIATTHSLMTGLVFFIIINLVLGKINQYNKVFGVNPKLLVGGIFGALIIYLVTNTIPKLGITITLTLVVASQILSGLYIDILISKQHLDFYKIVGALLVVLGVFFITLEKS